MYNKLQQMSILFLKLGIPHNEKTFWAIDAQLLKYLPNILLQM